MLKNHNHCSDDQVDDSSSAKAVGFNRVSYRGYREFRQINRDEPPPVLRRWLSWFTLPAGRGGNVHEWRLLAPSAAFRVWTNHQTDRSIPNGVVQDTRVLFLSGYLKYFIWNITLGNPRQLH